MQKRILWIAAGAAVLALAGAIAWQQLRPAGGRFVRPGYANDKQLIVTGWDAAEIRRIVDDFRALYRGQLHDAFDYEVTSLEGVQRVTFPHDIKPWMFIYLVNYAQYPKAPDAAGRAIHSAGLTTLGPDFDLPSQDLYGKKATFYVPSKDAEYDNVYVRIGDQTWKIPFEGDRWLLQADPLWPAALTPYTEHGR